MAAQKQKKSKAPDNRPARKRYWAARTLEKNKIKQLRRQYPGLTDRELRDIWNDVRQNRRTAWKGRV